jgi:hypothetical protein
LWKLDVNYRALAYAKTLRPVETLQTEDYRSKKIATHLIFTNNGVSCAGQKAKVALPAQRRASLISPTFRFAFGDALSAEPATGGPRAHRVVFIPPPLHILPPSPCSVGKKPRPRGTYNAIKIDLQLNRIGKSLICSHTGNSGAPRYGSRMTPIEFWFASRRVLSAQSSLNYSRHASTAQNRDEIVTAVP